MPRYGAAGSGTAVAAPETFRLRRLMRIRGGGSFTAQAAARVPDAPASLIWGGVGVTLITLIFGLLIFLCAALAWFGLDAWSARRMRAA